MRRRRRHEGTVGTVTHVDDHGTIILVWVRLKNGRIVPVNFDHRAYRNMHRSEGGAVEGREVEVKGDLGNQTLHFLD